MNRNKRGFTSHRHPELDSGSSRIFNKGFTLLEISVVVIIIAVLAAVAVPLYKHAVIKSRFSTVMPVAKSVADAQEVYYLGKNTYALEKQNLDMAPVTEANTEVVLSTEDEEENFNYVAANRTDVPNARYIMYQKNSPNFAENIHCEALDEDKEATWLCKDGLGGTPISIGEVKSLSGDEYTTYLLYGSITGSTFDRQCQGSAPTEQGETCPSGCGKKTATSSCDPHTGQWGEPEYNEDSCPSPLPDDTKACANGSGMMVRHSQCKADGSGYEYGAWDESACCTGAKPTYTMRTGDVGSSYGYWSGSVSGGTWECVNGQWQLSDFVSTLKVYGNNSSCTASTYYHEGAPNGGPCTGTYTQGGKCWGVVAYGCANSTFSSTVTTTTQYQARWSVCTASDSEGGDYGCANSTFNKGGRCESQTVNGCSGSVFNAGSVCWSRVKGGCTGAIFNEGSCCHKAVPYATCPTGVPICTTAQLQ